jgi:hypothetical protein
VPVGEQRDQHPVDQLVAADQRGAQVRAQPLEGLVRCGEQRFRIGRGPGQGGHASSV